MYRRTPILFRIVDSFFRHQLLFWSALLIVSSLTMAALYARSKTFHASAMTQVQTESVAEVLGTPDTNTWISPAQKNADRFMELAKQNQPGGFLDVALRDAHLATPINVDPQADDAHYAMLQKNLNTNVESANQFSINLTWDNQDETKNIVDALQRQYIVEVGLDRSSNSIATVHFLDSEIAGVTKQLHVAENALADFKRSNNGQLSDAESTDSNELGSLKAQLDDKRVTYGENADKKRALEQELALMKPMSVAKQTVSDQSPMERQVGVILAQREALLASGKTPQHPDVVALDHVISQLQQQQRNSSAPEKQAQHADRTPGQPAVSRSRATDHGCRNR